MISYNPDFLEKTSIFTNSELGELESLGGKNMLASFLSNKSLVDKYGIDFIHTSAQIEGNTYDKNDTYVLLMYGRTAGNKKYSDAKMIINMRDAYNKLISEELIPSKNSFKDMHFILSNEMVLESERGTPRNESVAIARSDYIPLSKSDQLNSELEYVFKKYNKIENAFDRALYLHCNLAYLQFFKDCNKRTARMMLNMSLKKDGKMLYIPSETMIREYLNGIVSYYETGDYKNFKEYFMANYAKTCTDIQSIEQINSGFVFREDRSEEKEDATFSIKFNK